MSIKLPSMLAFERKLETSDALMLAGNWKDKDDDKLWSEITITQRKNRSTQSAFGTKDADKVKPNPVSSDNDDANLPHDKDTLKVSFSLRVVGGIGIPFGCNDPEFTSAIIKKTKDYQAEGLKELAFRYAYNIASGRFLWRNRVCAERISVQISVGDESPKTFNGYDFPLNDFNSQRENEDLSQIAGAIYDGLNNDDHFVCLTVNAFVKQGVGQHVFPSQEMNMGEKKKILFKLGNCAALHSVKVGNAIRTIDDWYGTDQAPAEFPIAVEPFGAVTQQAQAYRKNKIDLYTLMFNWVNDKPITNDQKNYVMANLIRGGVFGGKADA